MEAEIRRADRPDIAGFTILEVLVALTVLGLVVAVLFEGIAGGLRRTSFEEDRLSLVLEAERIMARIDLDLGSEVALQDGADGDLRWRLERRPIREEDAEPIEPGEVLLVAYVVTVEAPDGRTLSVETKRVRVAVDDSNASR